MKMKELYETVMGLTDNLDNMGKADIPTNDDYKNRFFSVTKPLLAELLPLSIGEKKKEGGAVFALGWEDEIPLDSYLTEAVLPYGVVTGLIAAENPSEAIYFAGKYDENKRIASRRAVSEAVTDLYGGGGAS